MPHIPSVGNINRRETIAYKLKWKKDALLNRFYLGGLIDQS